jgi:transposase
MPHQAVSAPAPPPGARVWLACGYTDMRKGMDGLAVLAQQVLKEDPFGGALFAFRGRRGKRPGASTRDSFDHHSDGLWRFSATTVAGSTV